MNSGGLKISISSRMYNLSMYLRCILILANMSDSIEVLLQGGIGYMLVHLKMLVDELVLVVLIRVRVFLQRCMDCLEKKCVLMVRDCLYL